MATLDDLRALGYDVDPDDAGTVAIRGFGVAISIRATDGAALASLANPKAHAERKAQHRRNESPRLDALDG